MKVDWEALIAAEKSGGFKRLEWSATMFADEVVCERLHYDLSLETHQGRFTPFINAEYSPAKCQFWLMVLRPGRKRLHVARLCRCAEHRDDEHPVHWHYFEHIEELPTRVEPVLSLPQGTITKQALLDEFVSTMRVVDYQEELRS